MKSCRQDTTRYQHFEAACARKPYRKQPDDFPSEHDEDRWIQSASSERLQILAGLGALLGAADDVQQALDAGGGPGAAAQAAAAAAQRAGPAESAVPLQPDLGQHPHQQLVDAVVQPAGHLDELAVVGVGKLPPVCRMGAENVVSLRNSVQFLLISLLNTIV